MFGDNENLDSGQDNSGSFDSGQNNSQANEFNIPDEYADRGWVKNFEGKSGDDLKSEIFKSFDNSQSLIGKKASEYLTSTDLTKLPNFDEIKKSLLPQLAPQYQTPENLDDYALNDILKDESGNQAYEYPEEILNTFAGGFKELGLTTEQGQGLMKLYTEFETKKFHELTDATALDKSLNTIFGSNAQNRSKCTGMLKEFLSADEQNFLNESAPNSFIEMMYKVAKGMSEKYDYQESNSGGQRGGSLQMTQAEKDSEYNKLHDELFKLNSRPHSQAEKDKILQQIVALQK